MTIYDEWGGCCASVSGAMFHRLATDDAVFADADMDSVARMAGITARLLETSSLESRNACNAILVVFALTRHSDPAMDEAIAATALLRATIRHFLIHAPRFADCEVGDDNSIKNVTVMNFLVKSLTNQLVVTRESISISTDEPNGCRHIYDESHSGLLRSDS